MSTGQKTEAITKCTAEEINAHSRFLYESPIDLSFPIMKRVLLPQIEWYNENEPPRLMKIANSGDSVILSAKWHGPRPYITKGPLIGEYIFAQTHFHWGPVDVGGSEHTFDGVRMPLEVHGIFFKSKYRTMAEAQKEADGILFLAFLTELQEDDSPVFKPIVDNLYKIGSPGTCQHIELLPLTFFFPTFVDDYFLYWGSVVNINNVLWIICRKPLPISPHQVVTLFRFIRDQNRVEKKSNYRQVKPLQDRIVFFVNPKSNTSTTNLIIPLEELQSNTSRKSKKTKPKLSDFCKPEVKQKTGEHCYCFKGGASASTTEEETTESETDNAKPTIEPSDVEDTSKLKIIFAKRDTCRKYIEKPTLKKNIMNPVSLLPKENDSLLQISSISDLKQKDNEQYDVYLQRVEIYLKQIMERVEDKKKKRFQENDQKLANTKDSGDSELNENLKVFNETINLTPTVAVEEKIIAKLITDKDNKKSMNLENGNPEEQTKTSDSKENENEEKQEKSIISSPANSANSISTVVSVKEYKEKALDSKEDGTIKDSNENVPTKPVQAVRKKNSFEVDSPQESKNVIKPVENVLQEKTQLKSELKKTSNVAIAKTQSKEDSISSNVVQEKRPLKSALKKPSNITVNKKQPQGDSKSITVEDKRPLKSALKKTGNIVSANKQPEDSSKCTDETKTDNGNVNFNYFTVQNALFARNAKSEHNFDYILLRRIQSDKSVKSARRMPLYTAPPRTTQDIIAAEKQAIVEKSKSATAKLLRQRKPQLKSTMVTELFMNLKNQPTPSNTIQVTMISNKQNKVTNRPAWRY